MKSVIAGVVVVFNPDDGVWRNIDSYARCVEKLYIVDNSEESNEDKCHQIENSCYLDLGGNKGLAVALNIGAKKAIDENYEWLLTMDQDSSFSNDIVEIYSDYIENNDTSKIAVLSPQYNTERNKPTTSTEVESIKWTMQSASLFNLSIYKKIGKFKEKYFIDCIDYEYCLRAIEHGYFNIRCNRAVLNHSPAINKSVNVFMTKINYGYTSPTRIYYQVRNALDMWKGYHDPKSLGIICVKLWKIVLLFDHKSEYLKLFFRGIRDANKRQFGCYGEIYK